MLVELSFNPLGRGAHLSKDLAEVLKIIDDTYLGGSGNDTGQKDLAEVLKIIDDSGMPYCLTPFGTCIEGDWNEVMGLVKRCHERARILSSHVMTTIRVEDEEGASNKLSENIAAVERAADH